MLQIVLLIYGIVLAARLPGHLRKRPEDFPSATPELFEQWRRAEINSTVVVLVFGWGLLIVSILVILALVVAGVMNTSNLDQYMTPINLIGLVALIIGAIWSSNLSKVAKKTREQMLKPNPMQQGSFYPRQGVPGAPQNMPPPLDPQQGSEVPPTISSN